MRSSTTTAHRTIDLTSIEPRMVVARRAQHVAGRDRAVAAFRTTRRRRFAHGIADTAADASMATGGLAIANVSLNLQLGLPGGAAGLAFGAMLLAAGAALAMRRRGNRGDTDPASRAMPAHVIVLDDAPRTVIDLDATDRQHVA